MPKPIQHFLLVFDHKKDQLVELREFGTEAERATAEYGAAERKYRDQDAIDIVLVGSDSSRPSRSLTRHTSRAS